VKPNIPFEVKPHYEEYKPAKINKEWMNYFEGLC
jgi:hypothetical protein